MSRRLTALAALLLAVNGPLAWSQEATAPAEPSAVTRPEPFPTGYLDSEGLEASLKRVAAENPDRVQVQSLAKTTQGRDVWLATLGGNEPQRPAILIVANLEADHVVGSQIALRLIEQLAATKAGDAQANLLERHTLHIVPCLNPDGLQRFLSEPRTSLRTNLRPVDTDRDRREDEDGPEDIDGDGLVTTLRVRDQAATLIPDPDDPRILRKADPAKGERAIYSEYVEGLDNDQDGSLNEDAPGGVNLNRNWPHRWPEFDREAGRTPVSEPETRALIQFAFDHPEIAAILVYGLNDTLHEEPKKESGFDEADLPYLVALSKLYRETLKEVVGEGLDVPAQAPQQVADETPDPADPSVVPAPLSAMKPLSSQGSQDGSMGAWGYHQYGVLALAMKLWHGPDFAKERPDGIPEPPEGEEARWLYWNDRVLGSQAFAPLRPWEHPTLGRVLVGGWKPGVRLNPPADRIPALVEAQRTFLSQLSERLPRLEIASARAVALGGNLFEITIVVENTGVLPTALAQGVKTRTAGPILVRLKPNGANLLSGPMLNRVETLAGSGGSRDFRWLINATEGVTSVEVVAESPKAGRAVRNIELPRDQEESPR